VAEPHPDQDLGDARCSAFDSRLRVPALYRRPKADQHPQWTYYFSYYGVNQAKLEDYLAVSPEILSDHPMRREEFASIISTRIKSPELYDLLVTKGWGTPLKPLAWRGDLCFGPSQGQNVTFVRPNAWIGEWQSIEPHAALQEMLQRYLRAFGPATVEDFVLWWGARIADTRKLFKSLAGELELVDVEGLPAYALRDTIEPIQALEPMGTVCLLPLFDAYTMGLGRGKEIDALLPMKLQKLVYRPQGWISAIVLVDGFIRGTWEYKIQPGQIVVMVSLFSSIAKKMEQGITGEAERIGKFLNTKVVLEYKDI